MKTKERDSHLGVRFDLSTDNLRILRDKVNYSNNRCGKLVSVELCLIM